MAAVAAILNFRSERINLFLLSTSHLNTSYRFKSIGLSIQEKKFKIDFNMASGGHLGFLIETILIIFIYKSSRYFLRSFESFGSGDEVQNRFSRWRS